MLFNVFMELIKIDKAPNRSLHSYDWVFAVILE